MRFPQLTMYATAIAVYLYEKLSRKETLMLIALLSQVVDTLRRLQLTKEFDDKDCPR